MKEGLKADKEAIKAKIENCIKNARIEKAFDLLEENVELFGASKEDIHLARANYVRAEKDNELGLSDSETLGRIRSRTIRFIQRVIGEKRGLGMIGNRKFWIIATSLLLIILLFYTGKEYVFVYSGKDKITEYISKLKDPAVSFEDKDKLIEKILREGWRNTNVEVWGTNNYLMGNYKMNDFLYQLKFGNYEEYIIKSIDFETIVIKRAN